MSDPNDRTRLKAVVSGVGQIAVFGFSLAIAIPPIPSDGGVYTATPAMWMGGTAFAIFLYLARRPVWSSIGLMAVYLIFVWAVHARVFLG